MLSWAGKELFKLIKIWGDDAVQARLEGRKYSREIYAKISKAMKEAGFDRSPEQCRDKAKKLKGEYHKVVFEQFFIFTAV